MQAPIDITHYLPHRAPMLMVDVILRMDAEVVETVFEIKPENIFVSDGYFSESGLIENAAQTCSAIVAKGYYVDENEQDKAHVDVIGFISAIKTMKVHELPVAGASIHTHSRFLSQFVTDDYTLCTMSCTTRCGDRLCLEGEINLFIQEQPARNPATQ